MDQLKQVLKVLKQHRFWVISGTVSLIGVIVWFMATSALETEFQAEKSKIEGQYSKVNSVLNVSNHPNDHSHRRMDEINASTKNRVYQAWVTQWERQAQVLTWPPELEKDFEAVVTSLPPAETINFPTPPEQEIGTQYRSRYRDYIQTVLPKLAEIVDSNWDARTGGGNSGAGGGAMGGSGLSGFGGGGPGAGAMGPPGGAGGDSGTPTAAGPAHVVEWSARNQSAIASRYDWASRADNMPKTLEILYAQEDLWILTSLMHVIARANDGADARYKATVKQIVSIDLGTEAQLGGSVMRLDGGASGPGGTGAPGMMGPGMGGPGGPGMPAGGGGPGMTPPGAGPGMTPGGGPGMTPPGGAGATMGKMGAAGAGGAGAVAVDPLNFRYVDTNLAPLPAERIREAIQVKKADDALLAVVKRMPVRMQLVVDIRRVNRLLSECGNSLLPLEIRQVRINKQGASGGGGSGGGMDMMGDGGGMLGAGGGPGGGPPGGGPPGGGSGDGGGLGVGAMMGGAMAGRGRIGGGGASGASDVDPYETKIELFGLVYLFNRVNEAKLGAPKTNTAAPGTTAGGNSPPPGTTGATSNASPPTS